jgi:hypothetical protein
LAPKSNKKFIYIVFIDYRIHIFSDFIVARVSTGARRVAWRTLQGGRAVDPVLTHTGG